MKATELILLASHLYTRPALICYKGGHQEIFQITHVEDRRNISNKDAVVAITATGFEIWASQILKIEFSKNGKPLALPDTELLYCGICKQQTMHAKDPANPDAFTCAKCNGYA